MKRERLLHFTGMGSCFNVNSGNNAAYYFNPQNRNLLMIDCGESTFIASRKVMFIEAASGVDVLITHMHSDHIGSLPTLVLYCAIVKNIVPTIIFPHPEKIQQYLELTGCEANMYNLMYPEDYERYKLNVLLQEHVKTMPAYGYEITIDDKLIYYSGDTHSISEEVLSKLMRGEYAEFYQDVSIIPNDAHMQLDTLAELIPKEYRNKVRCMHYEYDDARIEAMKYGFDVDL